MRSRDKLIIGVVALSFLFLVALLVTEIPPMVKENRARNCALLNDKKWDGNDLIAIERAELRCGEQVAK